MGKLTAAAVRSLRTPGKYSDGDGLLLDVKAADRRYWTYRYKRAGRERWMTFGNADDITLSEARAQHTEARGQFLKGLDPLDERDRVRLDLSRSFGDAALATMAAKSPGWRNARTLPNWRSAIEHYANPVLGRMPIAEIDAAAVLKVLGPLWSAKPDVARRLRVRLEAVFDYAIALNWHQGPNPAVWRGGLKPLLAAKSKLPANHHAALDWREAPGLVAALWRDESMAARALAFLVLTASRSGEARLVRWSEIDLDSKLWTVPAARTKAGREHRVPLAPEAMAILHDVASLRHSDLVFPGRKPRGVLADVTLTHALRRAGLAQASVHGMRSTFRDWVADNGLSADAAEAALAHVAGSAVVRAYARSDLLDIRRTLMADWARFLGRPPATVVPLPSRAA
jgi:integrase